MKVQKFESVKVTISAVQYTGDNAKEIFAFAGAVVELRNALYINTKEGEMHVSPNDWVVKEPFPTGDRDFYPVKAEIFAKRYRKAGAQNVNALWVDIVVATTCLIAGAIAGYLYGITHPF
jgi:hypothetical protein